MTAASAEGQPPLDCGLCDRLAAFRSDNRAKYPDFYNNPVRSFGDDRARLLIVGLAPGLRGANRTGRPFTGDYAGDLLYPTLVQFGFAAGSYGAAPDDGLTLLDCRITNAVRCVPPENKPDRAGNQHLPPVSVGRNAGDAPHDSSVGFGPHRTQRRLGHNG